MKYIVGQVLYVVLKKDRKVIPALVLEEITRKTKEGTSTDFVLQVGVASPPITIQLSALDGEIFNSPSNAIETLTNHARETITTLVANAVEKAKIWYSSVENTIPAPPITSADISAAFDESSAHDHIDVDADAVNVVLPSGQRVKVSMPTAAA